jgi:glycosyltransferase involved in cell wall biosynthesis
MILSYNEIKNITHAIDNVKGWAKEIVILDSGSTDGTVEYAKKNGCQVYHRDFDNFSKQRKYLLSQLPVSTEWIFVLDADEYLTEELKSEVAQELANPKYNAYRMKRRFYWMGEWVKRGYYPTVLLRLGRKGDLDCDDREINEHLISNSGDVGDLVNDFIDENRNGISKWFDKHNNYSDREAIALDTDTDEGYSLFKSQYERKRWIRVNVWNRLPLFIRPLMLLVYRLFFQLAVLDGKKVVLYHFLHTFLYRSMIDAKFLENKWANNETNTSKHK